MSYSIFQNTMVDMTYTEIEESLKQGSCVLLPISVVEEHGPHLCVGTDIYLTETVCEKIQTVIREKGISSIIAPAFYWGVNSITNGFIGSFVIKEETMHLILMEILENFETWGFKNIFLVNFHGDYVHIKSIAKLVEQADEKLNMNVYFLNDKNLFTQLGCNTNLKCYASVEMDKEKVTMEHDYIDLHAGANETSWMLADYPDLVKADVASSLEPTKLTYPDIRQWIIGGKEAKKLTPNGYFGNPANINTKEIRNIESEVVEKYSNLICNLCGAYQ